MVVVGLVTLFMLAMVMGGGMQVFERIMPERLLTWLDENEGFGAMLGMNGGVVSMGGPKAPTGDAANDPAAYVRDSSDGLRGNKKVAPMALGQAVFVADVLAGRRVLSGTPAPGSVEALQPLQGCQFTAPSAGAFVGHVRSDYGSDLKVNLITYGDKELAGAVQQFARIYRKTGGKRMQGLSTLRFQHYDVVVTETQQPVYLVLNTASSGSQLWNIHLAPGARLERVVLLGGAQAGVVNLPPGVPVEVMLNDAATTCRIPPAVYPLNAGHMLFQSLEAGHLKVEEAEETLGRITAANATWDRWFRTAFGVTANATMAGGWHEGNISVVGPVPATSEGRAVYTSLSGGLAQITVDTYVEYPALKTEGADFASRVVAITSAFAWGDIENLTLKESF